MNTLLFSQLTNVQRAQADYLFADSYFGTDVNAYLYELNESGEVKSRSGNSDASGGRSRGHAVQVHMIEEVRITDELSQHVQMSMDALAASVASKIYLSQTISQEA